MTFNFYFLHLFANIKTSHSDTGELRWLFLSLKEFNSVQSDELFSSCCSLHLIDFTGDLSWSILPISKCNVSFYVK